jgi:hypothetical protein
MCTLSQKDAVNQFFVHTDAYWRWESEHQRIVEEIELRNKELRKSVDALKKRVKELKEGWIKEIDRNNNLQITNESLTKTVAETVSEWQTNVDFIQSQREALEKENEQLKEDIVLIKSQREAANILPPKQQQKHVQQTNNVHTHPAHWT